MKMTSSLVNYEKQFNALADQKRLQILNILSTQGEQCVCDLTDVMDLPQSKLSYHLKILRDAEIINVEKKGTWNYYEVNHKTVNHLLSEELCCLFRPASNY